MADRKVNTALFVAGQQITGEHDDERSRRRHARIERWTKAYITIAVLNLLVVIALIWVVLS